MLRHVTATRYVTPLREGGSLPGLMEADDLGTYVVKFTGAGQGRKALIAEIVCAGLARAVDLAVPELVLVDVDPVLADNEPDDEVQDLLRRSPGVNLGIDFLPGSVDLDARTFPLDPAWAGRVLWFDAVVGNVDRSWRNPNMLFWHRRPYLIDHGAALTFHHDWARADVTRPYDASEHALLGVPPDLSVTAELSIGADLIEAALADVPDAWLADEPGFEGQGFEARAVEGLGFDGPVAVRAAYQAALVARLADADGRTAALRAAVAQPRERVATRTRRPAWLGGAP